MYLFVSLVLFDVTLALGYAPLKMPMVKTTVFLSFKPFAAAIASLATSLVKSLFCGSAHRRCNIMTTDLLTGLSLCWLKT